MNNATAVKENQSINVDPRAGKYLTFFLASEEYGVEILKCRRSSDGLPITPVPRPPSISGGSSTAGQDPSHSWTSKSSSAWTRARSTDETCIIVIKTASLMMGILVDKVSEVVNVASVDIEDTPFFGADVDTEIFGSGQDRRAGAPAAGYRKSYSPLPTSFHLKKAAGGENEETEAES